MCYSIQNSRTCSGPQIEAFNIKSKQTRQKIFGPCCPSRTAFSVEGMFAAITPFKRRKVKDYKEACFVLGNFIVQVKTCRDFTGQCRGLGFNKKTTYRSWSVRLPASLSFFFSFFFLSRFLTRETINWLTNFFFFFSSGRQDAGCPSTIFLSRF